MAIKKIGILTGGGDCPGLNAVIAAALISMATTVFIPDGFKGIELVPFAVSAIIYVAMTFCSFKKLHPIAIIAISAVIGIGLGFAGII